MKNELERRIFASKLTLRAAAPGDPSPGTLSGYAAKFGTKSQDLGGFVEMLCAGNCGRAGCKGAFTRALKEKQDVRALFNHDANAVLGRLKTGTLKLKIDSTGLFWECKLPNTQIGRDVHTMVKDGLVDACSFAFKPTPEGEEWQTDSNKSALRILHDLDLFDVSAVTYPAYIDTNVSARNLGRYISVPVRVGVLLDDADRLWIRKEESRKMGAKIRADQSDDDESESDEEEFNGQTMQKEVCKRCGGRVARVGKQDYVCSICHSADPYLRRK
jgi:HK97 family phage prohead protease